MASQRLHMKSVLFLLSPHSPGLFRSDAAIHAATTLRDHGTTRIDISMDPRQTIKRSRHSVDYPVMDFNRTADNIIDSIFRPIVGHSDLRDLSVPVMNEKMVPSLKSLSVVGQMASEVAYYAENIGMMLFAALHARTPDKTPYNHLVIPDLTMPARDVLRTKFGLRAENIALENYGTCIDLSLTRTVITHISDTPSPARHLH